MVPPVNRTAPPMVVVVEELDVLDVDVDDVVAVVDVLEVLVELDVDVDDVVVVVVEVFGLTPSKAYNPSRTGLLPVEISYCDGFPPQKERVHTILEPPTT